MKLDIKRWFYLAACVVINICVGFSYSWSVFQAPIRERFGWDLAVVSFSFAIIMSVSSFCQPLAGKALEFFPPRRVIFVGGLFLVAGTMGFGFMNSRALMYFAAFLFGIGIALVYPCTVANMIPFFPDRRGVASGMLAAGMGFGSVIWAPLAAFIIGNQGVLSTFRIFGIGFLVVFLILPMLIKTAPSGYAPQSGKQKKSKAVVQPPSGIETTWRGMLKDKMFYLLVLAFIMSMTAGMMVMGHASLIIQESTGMSQGQAAVIVGLLALSNALGRIIWATLSDKTGWCLTFYIIFTYLFTALFLMWIQAPAAIFIGSLLSVGFCFGGFMGMLGSVTADTFGLQNLGMNFSVMFIAIGIAPIIGPTLGSYVKDYTGSYHFAFCVAAIMAAIGLAAAIMMGRIRKQRLNA